MVRRFQALQEKFDWRQRNWDGPVTFGTVYVPKPAWCQMSHIQVVVVQVPVVGACVSCLCGSHFTTITAG